MDAEVAQTLKDVVFLEKLVDECELATILQQRVDMANRGLYMLTSPPHAGTRKWFEEVISLAYFRAYRRRDA